MCATMCRHRALTREEALSLPADWWTEPAVDLAGGPVEVLWEHGTKHTLSTQPCYTPEWVPIDDSGTLKFPADCGECPTCQARKAIVSRPMKRPD